MQSRFLKLCLLACLFVVPFYALAQEDDMPQAGDTRLDDTGIEQVYVPAGCFMMGSSEEDIAALNEQNPPAWTQKAFAYEQPQHEVCLTKGYWIDKYEVTVAAFRAFVEADGYTTQEYWSDNGWQWLQFQDIEKMPLQCVEDNQDDFPQVCITWYEADAYAKWRGGSLPTEAQWEFAARGPEARIYPWGNDWQPELANVVDSEGLKSVGSYPDGISWVGAHDMAGNAMEWVQDWLGREYYSESERDDPTGPEEGSRKVEKGGWWGANPFVARSAYRHYEDSPTYQDHHIGFRVVSVAEEE